MKRADILRITPGISDVVIAITGADAVGETVGADAADAVSDTTREDVVIVTVGVDAVSKTAITYVVSETVGVDVVIVMAGVDATMGVFAVGVLGATGADGVLTQMVQRFLISLSEITLNCRHSYKY